MTVLFSIASTESIVMAADSAVTRDFGDHQEYDTVRKTWSRGGVGCVMTWGELGGGQFWRLCEFLDQQGLAAGKHCVHDLADLVYGYLANDYQPDHYHLGEVGYHVGGFDLAGMPYLYHVFWGCDRPRRQERREPAYRKLSHTPGQDQLVALYNGRNELAEVPIRVLVSQLNQGQIPRYNPHTEVGIAQFADFVMRFSAELTPQVSPPFTMSVMRAGCDTLVITDNTFSPIDVHAVQRRLLQHYASVGQKDASRRSGERKTDGSPT